MVLNRKGRISRSTCGTQVCAEVAIVILDENHAGIAVVVHVA